MVKLTHHWVTYSFHSPSHTRVNLFHFTFPLALHTKVATGKSREKEKSPSPSETSDSARKKCLRPNGQCHYI